MLHVEAHEIVVATGAAEIHPVCPGNRLAGLVTARAAAEAPRRGCRPWSDGRDRHGRRTACPPIGSTVDLAGFEGVDGRVRSVVTVDSGDRCPDDHVGRHGRPRPGPGPARPARPDGRRGPGDGRRRCGRRGRCSRRPRPRASSAAAWARPSRTSRPPGTTASPSSNSSSARVRPVSGPARAAPAFPTSGRGSPRRPARSRRRSPRGQRRARSPSAEAAADAYVDVFRKTPLHDEHLALGARMDRFGGWWRPWHYGDAIAEYWAVREGVSIGDVSTLGKLVVSGPRRRGAPRAALSMPCRGHQARAGRATRCSSTSAATSWTTG